MTNQLAGSKKLRIGILAHEFLINIGANDFLKLIITGLALRPEMDIVFLHPALAEGQVAKAAASDQLSKRAHRVPRIKTIIAKAIGKRTEGGAPESIQGIYEFYAEACPRMTFLACANDAETLEKIRVEHGIDIFMPSIHILPKSLPYVTYWPDCQPKHYPEFFDDEAQRVRDERIKGLFATGKPMIINSRDAKADMVKFYGADPNQIFNFPVAPNIDFDRLIPRPELSQKYPLTPLKYFIMCNQFWVHKSIETVIEAAWIAKKRGYGVHIALTGKMEEPRRPGYIESLYALAKKLDVEDVVKFIGYIPKEDQIELMKSAIGVIQPTLFEGGPGGGSIYDAMSVGVRAIVSDIPVNRELPVDGSNIVLFEKRNATDLADKMSVFMKTPYKRPSAEDLYQLSKRSIQMLSDRLYEAIDASLAF